MNKNESKIKKREYLSSIVQKIKNENNYDYNINNNRINLKKKEKKIFEGRNLKLNDSLSKEMQDITNKNTKSTINYEKILDKYENPIDHNSLSNSNKQIIVTIDTNRMSKENKEKNFNLDIIQIDSKNKTIENDEINNNSDNNELILNMKNKISIFIKIMKKYSEIFNNIINNISLSDKINIEKNEKINLENKSKNELIKIIQQFNKLILNPKLSENIIMSNIDDNNFLEEKISEILKEEKNMDLKKEDLDNLIEKYESKINILISENEILKLNKEKQNNIQDDLIKKNKQLEKENNELKLVINENNIKNENLLKKYNEIKNKMAIIENDKNLLIKENEELKNKIANNKNNNINNINQNEEISSLKDEISYKNSIIKYLEDILYNNKNKAIEGSLRDEYEKNKKNKKN